MMGSFSAAILKTDGTRDFTATRSNPTATSYSGSGKSSITMLMIGYNF